MSQKRLFISGGLTALLLAAGAASILWGGTSRGKSVAALAADLHSPEPATRHHAARDLAKLGPKAAEAVPALNDALKDPDKGVRHYAAKTLAELGTDAKPATEN